MGGVWKGYWGSGLWGFWNWDLLGNRGAQWDPEGMLRKCGGCWRSRGALGVPGVFGGLAAGGGGLEGLIGVWGLG